MKNKAGLNVQPAAQVSPKAILFVLNAAKSLRKMNRSQVRVTKPGW